MTRRLLVSYLTVTLLVLVLLEVPLGVVYSQRERERMAADVEHDATVIASIFEDGLERDLPLDPGPAEQYAARTGARVVVVDDAGIAAVDTEAAVGRDFSTRPEIALALEGTGSSGTRSSETLGTGLMYVAVPVASAGVVHGAVRVTLETDEVAVPMHETQHLAGPELVDLATQLGQVPQGSQVREIHFEAAEQLVHRVVASDDDVDGGESKVRFLGRGRRGVHFQVSGIRGRRRVPGRDRRLGILAGC